MDDAGLEMYLQTAAAMLGLPIRPEDSEQVYEAFRILREQAKLVTEFALPENLEQAPRFTP
jgi:hypothetical protein